MVYETGGTPGRPAYSRLMKGCTGQWIYNSQQATTECTQMALIPLMLVWFASAASYAGGDIFIKDSEPPWHVIIDIGKTVTLPCTVESNLGAEPRQITWTKIDKRGEEHKINTGTVIHEPFFSTLRFKIEQTVRIEEQKKVTEMPLSIQGIRAADNGTYRCDVMTSSGGTISVTRVLDVTVLLRKFSFTSEHEYKRNKSRLTFIFEEGVPQYVICHVTSLNHRPTLRILKGHENITPGFVVVVNSTTRGIPGLEEVIWDAYLMKPDVVLKENDGGKMLRCMAWFKEPFPKGTARRATLDVVFKPKFLCSKQHWIISTEEDCSVSCVIHGNPHVNIQSITWTYHGQDPPFQIAIGQAKGDFSSYISVDPLQDANDVTVILSIRKVAQYLSGKYELTASNSVGSSSMNITLNIAPETTTSSIVPSTISTQSTHESVELLLQSIDSLDISSSTSSASLPQDNCSIMCTILAIFLSLRFRVCHVCLI